MQRRDYLVAAGTTATTIASGTGHVSAEVSAQEDDSQQEDSIARAGQFELVAMDAPDEVEVMTPFTFSYKVANTADEDATFWTYVSVDRRGGNGFSESREGVEIPANAKVTIEDKTLHSPYLGVLDYHLQAFGESVSIDVVPAASELGETWRSPEDVAVTVERIEFTDAYEYTASDGSVTENTAPEGAQWAFLRIRAENAGNESRDLPRASDVTIVDGGQQFEREYFSSVEDAYESSEVGPGIAREGWIVYTLPADLAPEDVAISYREDHSSGEWIAYWAIDTDEETE